MKTHEMMIVKDQKRLLHFISEQIYELILIPDYH